MNGAAFGARARERRLHLAIWALASAVCGVAAMRGWLCDDAYITLRVVDNLANGYGAVWNAAERVQAYTHPLWMLALALVHLVTREFFLGPILLGLALTTASVVVLVRRLALPTLETAAALVALLFSRAFVDYSTSGLENPLSHLIAVVFFVQVFTGRVSARWLLWLSFTASLGLVNRMDLALVFLPALAYGLWRVGWREGLPALCLGQVPFVAWEAFSIWYYGFPFPNTYYAKLHTGIPQLAYVRQGVKYLVYSVRFDPVTLVATGLGVLSLYGAADRRRWLPVVGALLYLAHVVKVGGDFMDGRFLTVPLVCAAIALVRATPVWPRAVSALAAVGVGLVGVLGPVDTTLRPGDLAPVIRDTSFVWGINDERDYFIWGTSILQYGVRTPYPDYPWMDDGRQLRATGARTVVRTSVGMMGLYAGPRVHVIDKNGLGDALLARLPIRTDVPWRIGHFERDLPPGYLESVEGGTNVIRAPGLARYYDVLREITRGDLWSGARLAAIVAMNLGRCDDDMSR